MTLTTDSLAAALGGLAAVGGLLLAVAGLVGMAPAPARRRSRTEQKLRAAFGKGNGPRPKAWWAQGRSRMAAAALLGLGVWLVTGWLMGGLVTAVVIIGLPWLLNPTAGSAVQIKRLEAVEEWVRRMSDIHTVGISLEQSVQRSLQTVPAPIAPEVTRLVSRMAAGWTPQQAYRTFADELNDATVDEVAALLILHVEDRGAGLSKALRDLAQALADEVLMRRDVDADREKTRTNDRWVTIFCLVIFGVSMLSGAYVQPYDTWFGRLLLTGIGVAFIAVKIWMRKMSSMPPAPRFLSPADQAGGDVKEAV